MPLLRSDRGGRRFFADSALYRLLDGYQYAAAGQAECRKNALQSNVLYYILKQIARFLRKLMYL